MSIRRFPLAVGLLGLFGVWGCAERAIHPLPEPELRARIAAFSAERGRCRSIAAAFDMEVSGRRADGGETGLRCCGQLIAGPGRQLRVRAEKALGLAKLFDLLVVGDQVRFHSIRANKFYHGSLAQALALRGAPELPEELCGADLAELLFPVPALDGRPPPAVLPGAREVELASRRPDGTLSRRTWLAADTAWPLRTEIFDLRGRRLAVVAFDPPIERGGLHPVSGFSIRVGDDGRRLQLAVSFREMEINGRLSPAAFELPAPAGVETVELGRAPAGGRPR